MPTSTVSFLGEGSPTRIDYRKKGTLILTIGGPRGVPFLGTWKKVHIGEFINCSKFLRAKSAEFVELSHSPDRPWPRCKGCGA